MDCNSLFYEKLDLIFDFGTLGEFDDDEKEKGEYEWYTI